MNKTKIAIGGNSSNFLQLIERQAKKCPKKLAIVGDEIEVSYARLMEETEKFSALFQNRKMRRIAIVMSNCPAWTALDLAAVQSQLTLVGVPHFFSVEQLKHLLHDAQIDTLICDAQQSESLPIDAYFKTSEGTQCLGTPILIAQLESGLKSQNQVKNHTSNWTKAPLKISYTSGTTGSPKGVMISRECIDNTIRALLQTVDQGHAVRHINLLPFSLLLENIVGIYAVLASGGCCHTPSASTLGMSGSSSVSWPNFARAIALSKASSMITVPALLQGLVFCVRHLGLNARFFKTIAVGGAPISSIVLKQAHELGLPVFQGYGMTECGSVVCLNTPKRNRIGSVGKPLPHVSIRIDEQGEIVIGGIYFQGYQNREPEPESGEWHSGDLGYIDEQGYLFVTARKSSTYSTAYGRNIAPEWLESELDGETAIGQSAVFGKGEKINIAIISPATSDINNSLIEQCVERANQRLPDYAKISKWARASSPFGLHNEQRSTSGNLNRPRLYQDYQTTINALFNEPVS